MKEIFSLLGLFLITFCYSQETKPIAPINNTSLTNNNDNFSTQNGILWSYKPNSVSTVLGSNYLFDNWLNDALIYTIDEKNHKIIVVCIKIPVVNALAANHRLRGKCQ